MEAAVFNSGLSDMRDCLASTRMCDHDHPKLRKLVEEIVGGTRTPEEKARRIFSWVRDRIRFSIACPRRTATQTLSKGYGDCLSKTNAQVALLRATGIPARFRMVKAESVVLHHLVADFVYKQMHTIASHFWAECLLDDRWISCEAMLDKPLYEGMLKSSLITKEHVPTINWDGKSDLIVLKPWIAEQLGVDHICGGCDHIPTDQRRGDASVVDREDHRPHLLSMEPSLHRSDTPIFSKSLKRPMGRRICCQECDGLP